jgi:hypothetical protein
MKGDIGALNCGAATGHTGSLKGDHLGSVMIEFRNTAEPRCQPIAID